MTTTTLQRAFAARAFGFAPNQIGTIGRRLVEFQSYPFPRDDGTLGIMARLTPGDPMTLAELSVPAEAADLDQ